MFLAFRAMTEQRIFSCYRTLSVLSTVHLSFYILASGWRMWIVLEMMKHAALRGYWALKAISFVCTLGISLIGTKLADVSFMKQAFSLFIPLLSIYIYPKLRGKGTDMVDRATNSDNSIIRPSGLLHLL